MNRRRRSLSPRRGRSPEVVYEQDNDQQQQQQMPGLGSMRMQALMRAPLQHYLPPACAQFAVAPIQSLFNPEKPTTALEQAAKCSRHVIMICLAVLLVGCVCIGPIVTELGQLVKFLGQISQKLDDLALVLRYK